MVERIKKCMWKKENIRNIGIIAHIDHGKTTTSDSLLAGAGMLSFEAAGEKLELDFLEVEKERGITVQAADVNMVHEYEGEEYLINLIDTPGHVDFGGDVTRAIRAIDGALVIVDAVEGVMPQTETVLRQALKENVKPVLFINKCDRLISELRLPPEKIQERLLRVISDVNKLIYKLAPKEFKEKWQVNVQQGSVAFGSAKEKWALSFPFMQKTGITFKHVVEAYQQGQDAVKELAKKAPLHRVILDMIVKHLPSPLEAQKYRIPKIWRGDLDSEIGKALLNCDENAPVVMNVTKVYMDPHAGEVAVARIFCGTVERGKPVYLHKAKQEGKIQQIYVWRGVHKFPVDKAPAGNIIGISGFRGITAGETISETKDIEPFEEIRHLFEPVVTKAFEPKNPKDLQKLIELLKAKEREDPTLRVEVNEETGEILVSGLGELHLEILEDNIRREHKLDIVTSNPIVVYRETVEGESDIVEGKSPNKHNKFYIRVRPLPKEIYEKLVSGEIPEGRLRKKDEHIFKALHEAGMEWDEAKRVKEIFGHNIFVDMTKGIVHIGEVMEMCLDAFEEVMKNGPGAKEPVIGVRVDLVDAVLHEDAIHRGPAQVIPAVREAIKEAILQAKPVLYEPVQKIRIDVPVEYMGAVTKILQSRRGQLLNMEQEEDRTIIIAKLPVAESFGFTNELRSATAGRGFWFLVDSRFEKLPAELQEITIKRIRERKGLPTS